jgi:hypothetical protein
MQRRLIPFLAALVLLGTVAQAQVAAPELTPAAFHNVLVGLLGNSGATITPDNPAALQWSGTSLVAVGAINQTYSAGAKYQGYFAGYRGVGERLAFGIEGVTNDQTPDTGSNSETSSSAHLSLRLSQGLALGAGVDKGDTTPNQSISGKTLGVSAVLGKTLYFGAAVGRDKEGGAAPGERSSRMLGVAWRPMGAWRWHLAYDHIAKGDSTGALPGFTSNTLTIQTLAGNWLLGLSRARIELPLIPATATVSSLDVGWVPDKGGFSVTVRLIGADTGIGTTTRVNSLAVSYLF